MTTQTAALMRTRIGGASGLAAPIILDTNAGPIRLSPARDMPSLKTAWRKLERSSHSSYAQTFACAEAWARHVSAPHGARPFTLVGSRNGDTLLIWPFELRRKFGAPVLTWLGQEHHSYNMGLIEPRFAESITADDMRALIDAAAKLAGASALILNNQPVSWGGERNPFTLLPMQSSPDLGHAVGLGEDFEALYRSRFSSRSRSALKRKKRKLENYGETVFGWASDAPERSRLLEIFFSQKSGRCAELGQRNVFADPSHREFYRALAELPETDPAHLHIGYVMTGNEIAATFCGTLHNGRFIVLFSSLSDREELRRSSPGALLIEHQISDLCARGQNYYDMGAGFGRHKSDWCDVDQPLFDSMLPADMAGYFLCRYEMARRRAKRIIKNDPRLWALYDGARRRLLGRREDASGA